MPRGEQESFFLSFFLWRKPRALRRRHRRRASTSKEGALRPSHGCGLTATQISTGPESGYISKSEVKARPGTLALAKYVHTSRHPSITAWGIGPEHWNIRYEPGLVETTWSGADTGEESRTWRPTSSW